MKNYKSIRKITLGLTVLLSGSTVFDNGCFNTIASINVCGTILTFCTPGDQLNLLFPYLEVPDYAADPSCTIPLGCGDGDLFPDEFTPPNFPGGDAPDQPTDDSGGAGGGGG
ncbi:MAG TPA: hypothetical protein VJZ71_09435 [Phycisphaerae bacterium]|nr:hypothetical protein [Phycisphaerae bacterium]